MPFDAIHFFYPSPGNNQGDGIGLAELLGWASVKHASVADVVQALAKRQPEGAAWTKIQEFCELGADGIYATTEPFRIYRQRDRWYIGEGCKRAIALCWLGESGFEAFVHREICDARHSPIRGGYWRTWCTDGGRNLGVQPIRYDALEDWGGVAASLGLPTCELSRVNQTPDIEISVWTPNAIEAIGQVGGDDVERSRWQRPKITQADVPLQM